MRIDQSLKGMVAVVTGATSEAGHRQTLALVAAGARVVLIGRRIEELEARVADVRALSAPAKSQCADLTQRKALPAIAKRIAEKFGRVDILVNSARFGGVLPSRAVLAGEHDAASNPDVVVPFLLAQELVPYMKAGRRGRVINTVSASTLNTYHNGLAHGGAAAGFVQTTKAMAQAWSRHGITCNTIALGRLHGTAVCKQFTNANLLTSFSEFDEAPSNASQLEFDAMTVLLASRSSSNLNGHVIYGCTARTQLPERVRPYQRISRPAATTRVAEEMRVSL